MSTARKPILITAGALAAFSLLAGCGGDDGSEVPEGEAPAPQASTFPKPEKGQTLAELVAQNSPTNDIVAAQSGLVFEPGDERLGFGLFNVDGSLVNDADVAVYAAEGDVNQPALGPFPARIESMETEPEFVAETTSRDPDSAKVVYVADVPFDKAGEWSLAAVIEGAQGTQSTYFNTAVQVADHPEIPSVGDEAPSVHTETAEDVGGDLAKIDTRVPVGTMHEDDLADVLGKKPVVLLFATPALCVSKVCGPVVDVAEQVKSETGDDVVFIHNEIYKDNQPGTPKDPNLRPQVTAYGLATEPWLFVIDEDGEVTTRIEGPYGLTELRDAVAEVK